MPDSKIKQNLFIRINQWYDQIKEPYRVLIMLALVLPGILCVSRPPEDAVWLAGAGMIWLIVLAVFRVLYVDGYIRKKG